MSEYKNWRVSKDDQGITWLYFDRENMPVNTFSIEALSELSQVIAGVEADQSTLGLIITSAKKAGFVAGADIEQFTKVSNFEEAYEFVSSAHRIFDRLEALKIPTLALINGICLGGGFELALACRYRIAMDDPKTKLGLPEVNLGIFPGWGGSVRLPRLIGSLQALPLMLAGRTVSAKAAYKMGIVDAAAPDRHLQKLARDFILKKPPVHVATWTQKLTNSFLARKFLARKMRAGVMAKKVRPEHYPAPYALIENWEKYGVSKAAFDGEARAVSQLVLGKTAQNLIRVFFLQQHLKGLGKGVEFKPKHVHVIGAGAMGGDIAAWCALQGMRVTLQDREAKFIAPAMKRAASLYKKKLKMPVAIQQALDRLIPDISGEGARTADLVIEAIFENLEAKQALFKDLEAKMRPEAIMASNTSSIPLDEISRVLVNPQRLVGIHFFNPVSMMPLVEIVMSPTTSAEVGAKATAFARAIDRLPLPVKSAPGFLVNRVLLPYLMEACDLVKEGVPAPFVDQAALKFGMPMGPIELADTVGLDVCYHVAKNLVEAFGGSVPVELEEMVKAGKLGKKSGQGFYKFDAAGKPMKPAAGASPLSQDVVINRLIFRMLNESVACLREGIVGDKKLLDAGMVFGTGFAPFRGGPMRYIEEVGKDQLVALLETYAKEYGERYRPDAGWATI